MNWSDCADLALQWLKGEIAAKTGLVYDFVTPQVEPVELYFLFTTTWHFNYFLLTVNYK